MNFKTEQESFWAGTFGKDYIKRNNSEQLLSSKVALWARMLRSAHGVGSIREFGCNIGLNLLALKRLRPDLALSGIEINKTAADEAAALGVAEIRNGTILDPVADGPVDLTFTSGVLIHINPEFLEAVYDNLVSNSRRYVLVAEYYNPVPTSVPYRGHADRLFKRDFAGDLIDGYGLKLLDYGFVYKRDSWCPQDDVTWFLMEKG
ncbi:pseudaminic acid biosynthesis-associated methylase [Mesorhizobium sp. 8]|uniref:pseudaminic acid biosynthesis-associated methylase n=1 Tax=Mesorhizobium sp. 8 TaxID=2584466 RepID=UPI00111C964A|nr:pseudaminic acid biosynthesis-associated methylase [Mesorhizobium sp. 8]QDC01954.1 pseudaminic acid biosynthesis-associated methylase [Mesorhizobium sp. 8]